jgi:photosystem II stability/assembly factor-like uncharacterized protein
MKNLLFFLLLLWSFPVIAQQKERLLDSSFVGSKGWRIKYVDTPGRWILEASRDKGKTWQRIEYTIKGSEAAPGSELPGYPSRIYFVDDSVGFALGQYQVYTYSYFTLRTNDGGRSWSIVDDWQQTPNDPKGFEKLDPRTGQKFIHFSSSTNGFVFIGYIGNEIVLRETFDKGLKWRTKKLQTGLYEKFRIVSMKFSDAKNGSFELRDPDNPMGYKLVTSDGGNSWLLTAVVPEDLSSHKGRVLDSASVASGKLYRVVIDSTRVGWSILRSDDKGRSWNKIPHKLVSGNKHEYFPLYGMPKISIVSQAKVHFVNEDLGFVLCNYGFYYIDYVLLQTTDGGKNWRVIDHYPTNIIQKTENFYPDMNMREMVHFSDKDNGIFYVGESGRELGFLRTADGGGTWSYFTIPADGLEPHSMVFNDPKNGEIVLYDMNVKSDKKLVTKDGGKTWKMK